MNAVNDVHALRRGLGESSSSSQPLVFSSADAPEPGSDEFWTRSKELEDFQPLARAILGRATAAGCLVAIADGSDDCAQRQFCALQIARLLNEAGKRVLLIDAQMDGRGFSRSFDEIESEGLIDLVQYGSSPMATVQPSPILGLWMMGAGSFRPEGELESTPLHRALGQLRATHEIVLLPMPSHQSTGFFSEFLIHVDGVLLCAAAAAEVEIGEVVTYLKQKHIGLWGAACFGSEESVGEQAVDTQLDEIVESKPESKPTAPKPAATAPPKPQPEPAAPKQAATAPPKPKPAPVAPKPAATAPPKPQPEPAAPKPAPKPKPAAVPTDRAAAAVIAPRDTVASPATPEARPHPSSHGSRYDADRSSPLFRRVLIAAVAAFVIFVGWWGFTQWKGPSQPTSTGPAISGRLAQQGQPQQSTQDEPLPPSDAGEDAAAQQADGSPLPTEGEAVAQAEEVRNVERAEPAETNSAPVERQARDAAPVEDRSTPAAASDQPVIEDSTPAEPQPDPLPAEPKEPQLSAAERALREAPGDGGWSLHLWSFRKSTEAQVAARGLERDGLSPRIVEVDLNELGHWYRVVVGRYASRGDAASARALMAEWPGVEHVGLVRVP